MLLDGMGMVAAFALALVSLGDDVSHVLAAKASGANWVVLSKEGFWRLAVLRNAMRIDRHYSLERTPEYGNLLNDRRAAGKEWIKKRFPGSLKT